MGITPLGIIAAFVTLSETVGGLAATLTSGPIQVAFTAFAVGFPLFVGGAFFTILWKRSYVLYPPQDFGPEVDVKHYVDAMRQQAIGNQEILTLMSASVSKALSSDEAQALMSRLAASGHDNDRATLSEASSAIAKQAVGQLQECVVTIDLTAFTGSSSLPQLLFPFDPEQEAFAFLSAIYFQISDYVPPFTYGKHWALQDATSRQLLLPSSVDWRDNHALARSDATIQELGLVAGMRLRAIPLSRSTFGPTVGKALG